MAKLIAKKMEKSEYVFSSDPNLIVTLSTRLSSDAKKQLTMFDKFEDKIIPMRICVNNDILHCLAAFTHATNKLVHITYATSDPRLEGQINHKMK